MKKLVLITLLISIIMVVGGCSTSYDEAVENGVVNEDCGNGYFVTITEWNDYNREYSIVYAKDTKVAIVSLPKEKRYLQKEIHNKILLDRHL